MEIQSKVYTVIVIEYDRFFGQKELERKHFTEQKEAKEYAQSINSKNNKKDVPEYYIAAHLLN